MSLSLALRSTRLPKSPVCRSCRRTLQTSIPRHVAAVPQFDVSIRNDERRRTEDRRFPRASIGQTNEQIALRTVRLVDPITNKPHEPAPLAALLAVMDKDAYKLTLVTLDPEPLVKLIKSDELYKQKKEEQKKKKAALQAMEEKEIQMTWGVDPHDFKVKLKHAKSELAKGHRVNLVFAPRKGQPWLNADGMSVRVQEAVDQLSEFEYFESEWKARDVSQATTIVYLQGIKKEKTNGRGR